MYLYLEQATAPQLLFLGERKKERKKLSKSVDREREVWYYT